MRLSQAVREFGWHVPGPQAKEGVDDSARIASGPSPDALSVPPSRPGSSPRHSARSPALRPRALAEPLAHKPHGFTPVAHERDGFTLLEIILSLAILAGALAALGEVMRLGDQNAALTRDETQAQILASSVMDELMAGVRPLSMVSNATFDLATEPPWAYSIEITQSPQHAELLVIRVRVQQQLDPMLQPARYDLVRWVLNPDLVATDTSATAGDAGSSGSSSGASTSGSQGTGGGAR